MKRSVPFSAVFCVCLLICFGLVVGHPQKAVAHPHMDGDHRENDRDRDRDRDHDRDCDQEKDRDREHDGDKNNSEGLDHSGDQDRKDSGNASRVGSFLTTIVNYGTGGVASRSVITLHADHTMSVIDSGQGGPGTKFSSQLGAWKGGCDGSATGRTLDFSFPPTAGIARVDYKFDADQPDEDQSKGKDGDTIKGTIVLTVFPLSANPLDGGGTVVGHFEFTGQRIKVP